LQHPKQLGRRLLQHNSPEAGGRGILRTTVRPIKLSGAIELVAAGALPNDGKAIADERKPV
jgi:hypothetical protein